MDTLRREVIVLEMLVMASSGERTFYKEHHIIEMGYLHEVFAFGAELLAI